VNSLRQGADNEQVRYRQMIVVDENGREHIGIPMKFLDEPGQVHFAAPELGQHNTEIARRLGYSESQIRQLQESGAFA
jgi:crotonobetainyl-CoA:carnitine CoA-transferase CaiB-like acyl-CoA transferase